MNADDADPMDYYEEYSEWLMKVEPERIWNSDCLVRMLDCAHRFEEFLETRKA